MAVNKIVESSTCALQSSPQLIWASAQETLRGLLSADLYNLWFAPLRAIDSPENTIRLEVANDFCELWLRDNYLGLIRDAVAHSAGRAIDIQFVISNPEWPRPDKATSASVKSSRAKKHEEEENDSAAESRDFIFNSKNTFDTFVVGKNNDFAHAASLAVAQAPGKSYNPLFLYGGVGLGKTHLLHAIGQYVGEHKKHSKVAYVSSEKFTNEYIDAIQNNSLMKFRKKYRQTDVLLIDDIQFLAGKERIQEEFFHTFNALHEARKQIVMTCDRPTNELNSLEQRLVSRFEWGLVTDMQPPDVETRVAILRKKETAMNVTLPDEVMNFLAAKIRSNVRRLEGALIRVASFASLTGKKLSVEMVEGLLRDLLSEEGRYTISMEVIMKKVCDQYDIRVADMVSKRRPEHIAFPRQVAMFLARQLTDSSLSAIGDAFGGRDHGTVLHACRLVKDRMEVDPSVRQTVLYLEKQLQR